MHIHRRTLNKLALTSLANATILRQVTAATWPEKNVKIIVPFPPSGAIDVVARLVSTRLSEMWAQNVIIENHPGAGGNIGNELVARAEPNGNTLLFTQSGIVVNKFLYASINYDSLTDLSAVSLLTLVPNVMVIPSTLQIKTLDEFLIYAKNKQITYGSAGNGTSSHLCGALFGRKTGIQTIHVPYKGSAPALIDLIAGRLDLMIDSVSGIVPYIQSGKLQALGVTSLKPLSVLPQIKPLSDSVLPGFDANGLVAALAPAKTPVDIILKIQKDISLVMNEKTIKTRLQALGYEVVASTPSELTQYIKNEMSRWGPVIKEGNIKIDG